MSDAELPPPPVRASRFAFLALLVVALGATVYIIWPFRAPLFLAAVLATVLQGVFRAAVRLLRGRRPLAAVATTVGLLAVIVGPIAGVVAFTASQVVRGLTFVREQLGVHSIQQLRAGALPPRVAELLDAAMARLQLSHEQIETYVSRIAAAAEEISQRILASSGRAIFHTAIMLIAFYFLLIEGERLARWLGRVSPLSADQTRDLVEEFRSVARASILGTVLTSLFQAAIATLGYRIVGLPHPIFFGVLTLFASFIPVVGTLIVWLPACALLWLSAHHGSAVVLAAWCGVLVVGLEHVGKPIALRAILGGRAEMHTGLIFLSLLGGIEMFGLIGIILGPLVIAFLLALLRIYERDFRSLKTQGVDRVEP